MLWTDAATAVATVATTLILAAAGFIAARQLSETRSLRRAQVRPFVVIDFDVQSDPPFIYVRIVNVGSTMARDVAFEFDRPLQSSFDDRGGDRVAIADLPVLARGIPSLPPGKEIRFLFDSFIHREELPDTYGVRVKYQGHLFRHWPRKPRREQYEDVVTLDLSLYRHMSRIERRDLHDIHERLKEMRDEMKKWTAGGRGLLRLSPDDVRARDEAWMRSVEQRSGQHRATAETPEESSATASRVSSRRSRASRSLAGKASATALMRRGSGRLGRAMGRKYRTSSGHGQDAGSELTS